MIDEDADVLAALAQRRHQDVNHVEAIGEVEPEPAGLDFAPQIAVGRRHDPGVDAARRVLADAAQLAFLDDAQDLGLRPR